MPPGQKRSRTGCETCRARKVKCDERSNGCLNCERLQITCISRAARQATPDNDSESLRRVRSLRSCKACRSSKLRCSGTSQCDNCQRRGLSCHYEPRREPAWLSRTHRFRVTPGTSQSHTFVSSDTNEQSRTSPSINDTAECFEMESHWLFSHQLPDTSQILHLVKLYFTNFHPLRCFSFIHRPSFTQHIQDQSECERNTNMVLLAVCAIAAKFYALENPKELGKENVLGAGNEWARRAHSLVHDNIQAPSTDMIMAAVLLHEHALRVGNYAAAFVITGLAVRLSQALHLNLEHNHVEGRSDAPPSAYESCRRLMWSVYIMDAWVGSGVDELTMLNDQNIKIDLPVSEIDFVLENTNARGRNDTTENGRDLDLEAHFIKLVGIRKRALWVIKRLDTLRAPWLAHSEWSLIREELLLWNQSLPIGLKLTRSSVQNRKTYGQHGALLHLHITYHQTFCDLTRIGMSGLVGIRTSVVFPADQEIFVRDLQDQCFDHGMAISRIWEEALGHGMEAFADTWLCVSAHDTSRMQMSFLASRSGSSSRHNGIFLRKEVESAVGANAQALQRMVHIVALARPLLEAVIADLGANGLAVPLNITEAMDQQPDIESKESAMAPSGAQGYGISNTASHQAPENALAPLAIFRMARKDIVRNRKKRSDTMPESNALDGSPLNGNSLNGGSLNGSSLDGSPLGESGSSQVPNQPGNRGQLRLYSSLASQAYVDPCESMSSAEFNQQLPMSFDDLQAYMAVPLMMDGYVDRPFQGSSFGGASFGAPHWPDG